MSILIVEDNPITAKYMELLLQDKKLDSIVSVNAEDASRQLAAAGELELIILDMGLKSSDGELFFKKLATMEQGKNIPVVLCWTLSLEEIMEEAINQGYRHFLLKPVEHRRLLKKIQDLISIKADPEGNRAVDKECTIDRDLFARRYNLSEDDFNTVVKEIIVHINLITEILEKQTLEGEISLAIEEFRNLSETALILGAADVSGIIEQCAVLRTQEDAEP